VPLDVDGNLVGEGDRVVRTHQVQDNPGLVPVVALEVVPGVALEVVGAGWEDVPKTPVYVAPEDRRDLADVWGVVQESPVAPAASTLLGVSVLGYEGQPVEIEAIAVSD
jgi:hypothetical protein